MRAVVGKGGMGGKTLQAVVTVDDPGAYSKPFTLTFNARLSSPGDELMEYICNENNQDVAHIQGPPAAPGDPDLSRRAPAAHAQRPPLPWQRQHSITSSSAPVSAAASRRS